MDNHGDGKAVEITAKFRPSFLGPRFAFYCVILGVVGLLIMALAIVAGTAQNAHANTGQFPSSVYYTNLGENSGQGQIQNLCGCTGATYWSDSNDKSVSYTANNATFAWDVRYILIHYHLASDGVWHATDAGNHCSGGVCVYYNSNHEFPDGTGKARVLGNGNRYFDPISFTG